MFKPQSWRESDVSMNTRKVVKGLSPSSSHEHVMPSEKPMVIGLYGIPGSGKTFLLKHLEKLFDQNRFSCLEGSDVIDDRAVGGLEAFKKMHPEEQKIVRKYAIEGIQSNLDKSGYIGIVTGHCSFLDDKGTPEFVLNESDYNVYTHIIYLDTPAETIANQRESDTKRARPSMTVEQLREWQQMEQTELRAQCLKYGILFTVVPSSSSAGVVKELIDSFELDTESHNEIKAFRKLDEIIDPTSYPVNTFLVFDGDKTLTASDTGSMFWEAKNYPLNAVFGSPLRYSHHAFRQVSLIYREIDEILFKERCQEVAARVKLYPEFKTLLDKSMDQKHIAVVVITCGLELLWKEVLHLHGLSNAVEVIGNGRSSDGIIVTPEVKGALIRRLDIYHKMRTIAFGDSPLDLDMLDRAGRAFVVVGDEKTRSKSMEDALRVRIEKGLQAEQILLPGNITPRLSADVLPIVDVTSEAVISSILASQGWKSKYSPKPNPRIIIAPDTDSVALLTTPTRDARISGPSLRAAHHRIGWYLSTRHLSEIIGLETFSIPHVQGHQDLGHRLLHENKTAIVALMRGGEALAMGVSAAFPLAMFVHANAPEDVKLHHIEGQENVILVDSVINNGDTVVKFVQRVRELSARVKIVVVTGVVQSGAIAKGSKISVLVGDDNWWLVALRKSENKFTGTKAVDTGNRLFNTTHLK